MRKLEYLHIVRHCLRLCVILRLAVLVGVERVTDRRTDRQMTDTRRQHTPHRKNETSVNGRSLRVQDVL